MPSPLSLHETHFFAQSRQARQEKKSHYYFHLNPLPAPWVRQIVPGLNSLKKTAEFTPGPEDGTGVKSDFAFIYPGRDTGFYLFPFASGLIYE